MGPAADEAVPALLQCLDDPATRNNAFAALRSISAKPDVVVPVLIGHLSSPTKHQQGWALYCLSEFGADAKTAVPSVLKLLDDSYPYLRQAATNALKKIDPDAAAKAGVK
jgi:HEAT repeat protein